MPVQIRIESFEINDKFLGAPGKRRGEVSLQLAELVNDGWSVVSTDYDSMNGLYIVMLQKES